MSNYKPVILGFVLATATTVVGSFIFMRDEVNANRQYQESGQQYRVRFDDHLMDYHNMNTRLNSMEQLMESSAENRRELKDLLRRNEEMLMKVNVTLTQTSSVATIEIENINKRLDKAGL